jgi:hypothetical protein
MKKRLILALFVPLICTGQVLATTAPEDQPTYNTQRLSEETLDTLLAPIALYPDTLVTHILIASTYPLQVIEADRWRQDNQSLEGDALERALENADWDPSVKALVPFTDVLNHMSDDLSWLQHLGDAVITNEDWVLDRVQALRLQARQSGTLQSNDYQQVSTENKVIVIESRQPEVVYVPYYDTRHVYGHWHYASQPVFWPTTVRIALGHRIYWGPRVSISAGFYFGNIWWPERHIIIRSTPSHRYVRPHYRAKRYSVKEYHRWQHNVGNRHARYSQRVVTHKPAIVKQHRSLNTAAKHRELYTRTHAAGSYSVNGDKRGKLAQQNSPQQKPRKYSQDATQLKQRLKSHDNGNRGQQRDLVKAPKEQARGGQPGHKQREFAPAERQKPLRQKPQERAVKQERKWVNKAPAQSQRSQKAYSEPRQSRPVKQSHSRPASRDHAQKPRVKREH